MQRWTEAIELLPTHIKTHVVPPATYNSPFDSTQDSVYGTTNNLLALNQASWNIWKAHKAANIDRWKTQVQDAYGAKSSSKLFKLCTKEPRPTMVESEKTFVDSNGVTKDASTRAEKRTATFQRFQKLYGTNLFKSPPYFKKSHHHQRDQPSVHFDTSWPDKEDRGYQAFLRCKSDAIDWAKVITLISEKEFSELSNYFLARQQGYQISKLAHLSIYHSASQIRSQK